MAWVKKNLIMLIAAVISLGLLGYAIFFVKGKMDKDAEVTATLEENANKFKDLLSRKVHPGNEKVDNIKIAQGEIAKMRTFMDEEREYIKGPPVATNLNNQVFRAALDTSISELRKQAEQANVVLPNTNYWFTFTSYKTTVDFKDWVQGLAAELADIKAIMRILCDARVHSIVALRRVPVNETEYQGMQDYVGNRYPKTNDWAITTGYEVTFQGFSSELARVMEGMANAKETFVVKSVGVAQAPEDKSKTPPPAPMMSMPMRNPYGNPYANPYGGMGAYGQRMPMPAAQPLPAAQRQTTQLARVLDESRLRFTLQVDSIRLKPKQQQGAKTQVAKAAGDAKPGEAKPAAAGAAPAAETTPAAAPAK